MANNRERLNTDQFRVPVFGNICKICFSTENIKLCAKCKMVTYCSREHQILDWTQHKRLCKTFEKVHNVYKTLENFNPLSFIHCHGIAGMLVKPVIKSLKPEMPIQDCLYYESLAAFPRVCNYCFWKSARTELYCQNCHLAGYCSVEHMKKHSVLHGKHCTALKHCRIVAQFTENKDFLSSLHMKQNQINLRKFSNLEKLPSNLDALVEILWGLKWSPEAPPKDLVMFLKLGDIVAPILTMLNAMEHVGLVKNRLLVNFDPFKPFEIHIVGCGWIDFNFVYFIERLFRVYIRNLGVINLVFTQFRLSYCQHTQGPFINMRSYACLYEDIVDTLDKPDLVVCLNAFMGMDNFGFLETSADVAFLRHQNVPLVITCPDSRILSFISLKMRAIVGNVRVDKPITENPFKCKMPVQVWNSKTDISKTCLSVTYTNQFVTILTKQ